MADLIEAVLIESRGKRFWCQRMTQPNLKKREEHDIYAYRDVLSGQNHPPHQCREVREGIIRIEVVEVEQIEDPN
jgi:hypothetical protein